MILTFPTSFHRRATALSYSHHLTVGEGNRRGRLKPEQSPDERFETVSCVIEAWRRLVVVATISDSAG